MYWTNSVGPGELGNSNIPTTMKFKKMERAKIQHLPKNDNENNIQDDEIIMDDEDITRLLEEQIKTIKARHKQLEEVVKTISNYKNKFPSE